MIPFPPVAAYSAVADISNTVILYLLIQVDMAASCRACPADAGQTGSRCGPRRYAWRLVPVPSFLRGLCTCCLYYCVAAETMGTGEHDHRFGSTGFQVLFEPGKLFIIQVAGVPGTVRARFVVLSSIIKCQPALSSCGRAFPAASYPVHIFLPYNGSLVCPAPSSRGCRYSIPTAGCSSLLKMSCHRFHCVSTRSFVV